MVELWREYAPASGASFSAAWRSSSDWFVGDDAGNLHMSRDAATWRVVHRFGGAVTGLYFDEEEENTLWVCTGDGEIWGARTSGDPETWDWQLAYSGDYAFTGIGLAGTRIVAVAEWSQDIVTGADFGYGEWTATEVFPSALRCWGVGQDYASGTLWVATYTGAPYYTTDGVTFAQTAASTGIAVAAIDEMDGTISPADRAHQSLG